MEEAETASGGRDRFLGGVVVDDASAFAAGRDFPYEVAEAVVRSQLRGQDWAKADLTRPLRAWRRRTPPNAYLESLDRPPAEPGCEAVTLVLPDYTDFPAATR